MYLPIANKMNKTVKMLWLDAQGRGDRPVVIASARLDFFAFTWLPVTTGIESTERLVRLTSALVRVSQHFNLFEALRTQLGFIIFPIFLINFVLDS